MTARLPIVGGDDNDWGSILNDFLDISHNSDGTLSTTAVSNALPSPIPTAKLGNGSGSSSNFLRGDGVWAVPAGGGLQAANNLSDVTDVGSSRANLHIPDLTPAAACGNNAGGIYTAPNGNTGATFAPFSGAVDGYFVNVGDMILLVNETTGSNVTAATNGLWQVQVTGPSTAGGLWVRPAEFASGLIVKGRNVTVMGGSTNSGLWFLQTPTAGITIDSSAQTWQQLKSSGQTQLISSGPAAYSTTYVPGDVITYKGGHILVTTGFTTGSGTAGTFPFISGANYISLGGIGGSVYMASDYGVVGDGTTDNGAKLNTLIQAVSAASGGNIYLPTGITATSIPIVLYPSVHLWGTGFNISELRLLANANCDVVQFYKSPDASISNAFFCGLWNMEINGNSANQSPTDFHMGINLTTNPVSSGATHDLEFDPTHIICNVRIKSTTGHAWYAANARNGMRLIGVWVENVGGHAFYSGTDTEYTVCHAQGAGLAGWYVTHSSAKGSANKSYNNGLAPVWTSGTNYSAGAYVVYSGNLYRAANALTNDTTVPSSDTTNWTNVAAAAGAGYGWYFDGGTATESAWSACDAQQNAAGAIYMHNCGQVNFHGSVSQVNTGLGIAGGTNLSSNPNYYSAVTLDNSSGCMVSVVTQAMQFAYVVRIVNGATHNDVHVAGDMTAAATLSPDTTALVGSGNAVSWNGAWLSDVTAPVFVAGGLTGATAPSRYVGATASGAPASGTFVIGDFIVDQTGALWVCTTAGSPGTWTSVSGSGGGGGATATLGTNTFTGNQTAPVFAASGLTGATATSRYVGATVSGAPTTGTFAVGDFVIDQTAKIWVCTIAGSPGTWTQLSGSGFYGNLFGDGSLGSFTMDGTTTHSFMSLSSNTYTLSDDVFFTSLTINSGVTLVTNNFRVFCTGAITNSGTISNNGNAGSASGTAGAAITNGPGYALNAGGAGATGNGSAGSASGMRLGVGSGGAGGTGSSGTAGGAGSSNGTSTSRYRVPAVIINGVFGANLVSGGCGGGGGGGDGTNKGGGGGSGAGIIALFAHSIVNGSGASIIAQGGAGGTPTTGNAGGGGGGGGGLITLYTLVAWTNNGTTSVTGGAAGLGVGTGSSGIAGSNGQVQNFVLQ